MTDNTFESACAGKRAFRSPGEAIRNMRGLRNNKGNHGAMGPYRCMYCGLFHLGHSGQRKNRPKRELVADQLESLHA